MFPIVGKAQSPELKIILPPTARWADLAPLCGIQNGRTCYAVVAPILNNGNKDVHINPHILRKCAGFFIKKTAGKGRSPENKKAGPNIWSSLLISPPQKMAQAAWCLL